MKRFSPLLAGLTVLMGAALCEAAPVPAAPVYTNKPRFRIPFRYDAAEMQSLGAKEIRLFVSRDRGANWQQVQAQVIPANGQNTVTESDSGGGAFYRLQKP